MSKAKGEDVIDRRRVKVLASERAHHPARRHTGLRSLGSERQFSDAQSGTRGGECPPSVFLLEAIGMSKGLTRMAAPGARVHPGARGRPVTAKYLGGERVVTKARPRCVRRGVVPAEVATAVAPPAPVLIASAGVMMASTVD